MADFLASFVGVAGVGLLIYVIYNIAKLIGALRGAEDSSPGRPGGTPPGGTVVNPASKIQLDEFQQHGISQANTIYVPEDQYQMFAAAARVPRRKVDPLEFTADLKGKNLDQIDPGNTILVFRQGGFISKRIAAQFVAISKNEVNLHLLIMPDPNLNGKTLTIRLVSSGRSIARNTLDVQVIIDTGGSIPPGGATPGGAPGLAKAGAIFGCVRLIQLLNKYHNPTTPLADKLTIKKDIISILSSIEDFKNVVGYHDLTNAYNDLEIFMTSNKIPLTPAQLNDIIDLINNIKKILEAMP